MPHHTVLHIPHDSVHIPAEHRASFLLSDAELDRELLRITDAHTDDLFTIPGAAPVTFPVSRLLVDPEGFEDDALEPMASRGMGVLYTHTTHGQPLRAAPSTIDRARLLDAFYHPHHARLTQAVDAALGAHGECLVVDAHSFPSVPLPCELDQAPARPELCLGTDAFHTPGELLELARQSCERVGWSVEVNRPFAGALVPMAHYRRDARVQALMIEVRRDLYMDEATGARNHSYDLTRTRLQAVLRELMRAGDVTVD